MKSIVEYRRKVNGGTIMIRKIIKIDEKVCTGCGLCVDACHEGAIALIDGVAKLTRDDYCDGLGDCLPSCPVNAISFEERDTLAYDEAAVKKHIQQRAMQGRPGTAMNVTSLNVDSALRTWPVQIKLMPLQAPYYQGAQLLIAADCTAYAYANFHHEFMRGKVVAIGCPKLDAIDYSDKMAEILKLNDIISVHVVRMEVPCCGGMSHAMQSAIQKSGKRIPYVETIITTNGEIK